MFDGNKNYNNNKLIDIKFIKENKQQKNILHLPLQITIIIIINDKNKWNAYWKND